MTPHADGDCLLARENEFGDLVRHIGRTHWACCNTCRTAWCVGHNLFSETGDEPDWIASVNALVTFRIDSTDVEPLRRYMGVIGLSGPLEVVDLAQALIPEHLAAPPGATGVILGPWSADDGIPF